MKQQHCHRKPGSDSAELRPSKPETRQDFRGTGKAEDSTFLCIHIVGLKAIFAKEGQQLDPAQSCLIKSQI